MTLSELQQGQQAQIAQFCAGKLEPAMQAKLMAMGLVPGSSVQIVRRAPFGQALQLTVAQAQLCIDPQLAQCIEVEA